MGLAVELEQPAVDLAETRGGAFIARLAHHSGVKGRPRSRPRRAGPQALLGHRGDQFSGPHRLAGFAGLRLFPARASPRRAGAITLRRDLH